MARQFAEAITVEFPEFLELRNILNMAVITWPRFGLSAMDLSKMDSWQVEMLRVIIEE